VAPRVDQREQLAVGVHGCGRGDVGERLEVAQVGEGGEEARALVAELGPGGDRAWGVGVAAGVKGGWLGWG